MKYDEVKKIFSICGDCRISENLNTISIGKSKEVDYLKIVINDIFEYTLIDNDWIIFEELPKEDLSTPILTTVRKDINYFDVEYSYWKYDEEDKKVFY